MYYRNKNGIIYDLGYFEKFYLRRDGVLVGDATYDSVNIEVLNVNQVPDQNFALFLEMFYGFLADGETFSYSDIYQAMRSKIIFDRANKHIERIADEVDKNVERLEIRWE